MPRLRRDAQTWLLYLQLSLYGYFLYGFSPAIPLLRADQGVSRAVSGLHGTAFAVGVVIAGLAGAAVVARVGRRRVLWGGLAGLCAGVLLFVGAAAVPLTLLAALACGASGSLLLNTVTAALSDHAGPAAAAAISEANGLGAGVGMLAPLALGVGAATALGWRLGPLLLLPLAGLLFLAMRGVPIDEPARRDAAPETARPSVQPGSGSLGARYWWAWVVLMLLVGTEFGMTIWSSDVLRERVGLPEGAAAAGVTAIVLGMGAGRIVGARLALRLPVDRLLLAAIGLALAGFALFWSASAPVPAYAGLLVTGLGLALHFPLSIARAVDASAGRPDLATARAGLAAGLAIGVAPFALGALADAGGPHRAMLVVPVLLGLAAAGVVTGPRPAVAATR